MHSEMLYHAQLQCRHCADQTLGDLFEMQGKRLHVSSSSSTPLNHAQREVFRRSIDKSSVSVDR